MGNLAVFPLIPGQEREFLGHQLPLAEGVHGEGVDRRVAAEEPAEAGAGAVAREPPSGHEAAPQCGVADPLLLQVDLGPFEGQIQLRIGGLDRGGGAEHGLGPCPGVPIEHLGARDQPAVAGEDGVARGGPGRYRDGNELAPRPLRVDRDDHRAGGLAQLMRRMLHRVGGPWRAHDRVARLQALGEDKETTPGVPKRVLTPDGAGPHVVEDGFELDDDLQRLRTLHFQEHEDARGGGVGGRQDVLPHLEGRVAVRDGGEFRPDLHAARHFASQDRRPVARGREAQAKGVADLERVHPQLGFARLESQPGRARADHAEVFPGPYRTGEFNGGGGDVEAGDGQRGQVAGGGCRLALGTRAGGPGVGEQHRHREGCHQTCGEGLPHLTSSLASEHPTHRRAVARSRRRCLIGVLVCGHKSTSSSASSETERRHHLSLSPVQGNE